MGAMNSEEAAEPVAALPERADVVVIGAGPAGLTLATLLKKYRPATSVIVLEKKTFPRHRVGESLIIDINRVLLDMEVIDEIDAAGFVPKYGSTFVWGDDRTPRTFLWPEWDEAGYLKPYTWHVERPQYDQILADAAVREGASIFFERSVTGPIMEGDRVVGLHVRDEAGEEVDIACEWAIDCGGFGGPLTRRLAGHSQDDALRNIAVWGYHRNIGWRDDLNGSALKSRALLMSHDTGWVWILPISHELTSVGFVTSIDAYQAEGVEDQEAWYRGKLATLPEGADLFADAELVDYRGDGKLVHAIKEFSYACDRLWGPGWVLAGDSSGFVDAILSIGCFLAQHHGQFLSYALASVLDGDVDEEVALDSYQTTVKEGLESFRAVAHMLYAFNSQTTDWWRECSSVLRESMLVPQEADPGAFRAFFTGFSTRNALYDDAVGSFGGHFLNQFSKDLFAAERLFHDGKLEDSLASARELLRGDPVLRLVAPVTVTEAALPRIGTGRVWPVVRLGVELPSEADAVQAETVARRMYVPAALAPVAHLLDGRRRLSDIASQLIADGLVTSDREARREVTKVAYRLACMGALVRVEADAPVAA